MSHSTDTSVQTDSIVPNEILVIQTAFLGDLLLSVPLFKELKRREPGARLTVLCRKGLSGVLRHSGLVDEVIEGDKSSRDEWARVATELRRRHFKIVVCPHESFRSAWLVRGLKAERKVGYPRWFNRWIFDERVERPMHLPEALRQLALLEPLEAEWRGRLHAFADQQGAAGGQVRAAMEGSYPEMQSAALVEVPSWAEMTIPRLAALREEFRRDRTLSLASSEKVRALAARFGEAHGRLVFLAPGSVWPTKQWTPEGYAEVARTFLKQGDTVVLMGSAPEKALCEEIASHAPGSIVTAGETSLWESAELLALADLLVCNDSGAMHMAAASGVPTVSVFGPTILDFGYRPWQNHARVVQVPLACRPCGKHGARKCPLGTHACMKQVKAEAVLHEGETLLKSN
jgi:heptosyltransferase-2